MDRAKEPRVKHRTPKLKALLNRGENAVLGIAESVCSETGTKVFAKVRIADVVQIDGSGISNDLYRYALSAHFDVLVAKDNEAFLAIEFDGSGHDPRNDLKKAKLCDYFHVPMVRVRENHLKAQVLGDTAVAFLIWQLSCVDAFIEQCGDDPYEPYDPAWFRSIPGKDRQFPFMYTQRWRGKLVRPFRQAASRLNPQIRPFYAHGLVQFGAVDFTYYRGTEYRSVCAQMVGDDLFVYGEAELGIDVHGLEKDRMYLFCEIATFVEGMAAERMHHQAISFLNGTTSIASPYSDLLTKRTNWEREGFRMKQAFNSVPQKVSDGNRHL